MIEVSEQPHLDFPCDFIFKVVGMNDPLGQFSKAVQQAVSRVVPIPLDAMKEKLSSGGNYVSVSVVVRVTDWPQVHAIYSQLRQVPGIKYLL